MKKIARRQFIQIAAVGVAAALVKPGRRAYAEDMPHLSTDDPTAQAMKYTEDASTVKPVSRSNSAPDQHCGNCALSSGAEGDEWLQCQIFPGKMVHTKGWCSVWTPKT